MSVFHFYFNANLTLPALKSKLIWNFFVNSNCMVYKVACNSVAPKRSSNIDKTSRQSTILDKLLKSINFQLLARRYYVKKKLLAMTILC